MPPYLTIDVFDSSDIIVSDHADPSNVIQGHTEITSKTAIDVGAVANARLTVNQIGKYAKTFVIPIVGDTAFTPILDVITPFDVTANVLPTVVAPDAFAAHIAFTSAVHITQKEMVRTLDNVSSNADGLAYLNLHNQSQKDQMIVVGHSGVNFVSYLDLHVTGNIIVTTDSYMTGNYAFNPENADHRKVLYSPSFPPVVDYATLEALIKDNIVPSVKSILEALSND